MEEPDFEKALEERDIRSILGEMRRRPHQVEVQQAASDALFRAVQHHPATAKEAVQQGCFDALKCILDCHPEGSAPNEAALLALGCLADHGMVSFGSKQQVQDLQQKKHKGKAIAQIRIVPEEGF
eukprot:g30102.t1